jgi:hypothetical protein
MESPIPEQVGDSRMQLSDEEDNSQKNTEDDSAPPAQEKDDEEPKEQANKESTDILPEDIIHIIQFCHLCTLGKVTPVLYSLSHDPEISDWFNSLPVVLSRDSTNSIKRQLLCTKEGEDDDSEVLSPENKISKKDHYLINTMIKLHDSMDKMSKTKEKKEPGFKQLESYRKQLILNASAVPPFSTAATAPTEFYKTFLAKKSQLKAKDMLLHRFHSDKVAFNPNPTFITNLWNCEFQAVVALCFGPRLHSATFLQEWFDHIYDSCMIYTSSQASDPYFFAKVMFAIDNALQNHWRSCSSASNRASVNDSVLHMSAVQESILSLNFTQ